MKNGGPVAEGSGALPSVDADQLGSPLENRMTRPRAENRCADQAGHLVGGEEVEPLQQRVERSQALDVRVHVHASMAGEDVETKHVGKLHGALHTGQDLGRHAEPGDVVVAPEPLLPAGMVTGPGLAEGPLRVRQRAPTEPDPVEHRGNVPPPQQPPRPAGYVSLRLAARDDLDPHLEARVEPANVLLNEPQLEPVAPTHGRRHDR